MPTWRRKASRQLLRFSLIVSFALLLSGWKVLTIEEDRLAREQYGDNFNATAYVDSIWEDQVLSYAREQAEPIATVIAAAQKNLDAAGQQYGHQPGEGSPWTFLATGTATVTGMDTSSRAGTMSIAIDNSATTPPVKVLIGPVIIGTVVRDALPFITFNDFANQIVFAEVGNALTARALSSVEASVSTLQQSDRIRFVAAFALRSPNDPVELVLMELQRLDGDERGQP